MLIHSASLVIILWSRDRGCNLVRVKSQEHSENGDYPTELHQSTRDCTERVRVTIKGSRCAGAPAHPRGGPRKKTGVRHAESASPARAGLMSWAGAVGRGFWDFLRTWTKRPFRKGKRTAGIGQSSGDGPMGGSARALIVRWKVGMGKVSSSDPPRSMTPDNAPTLLPLPLPPPPSLWTRQAGRNYSTAL